MEECSSRRVGVKGGCGDGDVTVQTPDGPQLFPALLSANCVTSSILVLGGSIDPVASALLAGSVGCMASMSYS